MRWSEAEYANHLARERARNPNALAPDATPAGTEWKLHDEIAEEVQRRGWYAIHSRMDKATTQSAGVPDWIIFGEHGRVYIIEAKTRASKLSMEQQAAFAHLQKLGFTPQVVRSLSEFLIVIAREQTKSGHAGDCTIFAAMRDGFPTDGLCTCGHGWKLVRANGDYAEMYSDERRKKEWNERTTK